MLIFYSTCCERHIKSNFLYLEIKGTASINPDFIIQVI